MPNKNETLYQLRKNELTSLTITKEMWEDGDNRKATLDAITNSNSLQTVIADNLDLSAPQTQNLVDALKSHQNLTALDVSHSNIGDEGARAIAEGLQNLTVLNVKNNRIKGGGAEAIAKNLSNLTALDIGYNEIGNEGVEAIAENLPKLTALNVESNGIEDEGITAIAEKLAKLTTLSVAENQIGDRAAKSIVAKLKNLAALDMERTQIGEEGSTALESRGLPGGIDDRQGVEDAFVAIHTVFTPHSGVATSADEQSWTDRTAGGSGMARG